MEQLIEVEMIKSKILRIYNLAIFIGLISGCVSAKGWMKVVNAPLDLSSVKQVKVTVKNSCDATTAEEIAVYDSIVQGLRRSGRFHNIEVTKKDGNEITGNILLLETEISGIKRVDRGTRIWWGAMAGRGWIQLHVRLIDRDSKQVRGEAIIEGFSSAGNIFAGTTEDAIKEASAKAVEFVESGS